jgi:hypothetical protein
VCFLFFLVAVCCVLCSVLAAVCGRKSNACAVLGVDVAVAAAVQYAGCCWWFLVSMGVLGSGAEKIFMRGRRDERRTGGNALMQHAGCVAHS